MNTISGFGFGSGVNQVERRHALPETQFTTIEAKRVLPAHYEVAQVATYGSPHGSTQVSLSEDVTAADSKGKMLVEKYEQSVEQVRRDQTADNETESTSLLHLAPLELFNQADVEAYEKRLAGKLAELGVDSEEPIRFSIDSEGYVRVQGDHPQKAEIEAMFAEDQDLRNGMVQSQNFYLFREMYQLHQQWAEKIEAGVNEEIAGAWLVNAVGNAVAKSSNGLTFQSGKFADPFGGGNAANALAAKAYG